MSRLNRIFAVSSIALFLSVVWLIANDNNREWKQWQRLYLQTKAQQPSATPLESSPVYDFIRDLPLFDFMDPALKIQQVALKQLTQGIYFTDIPRVDRCTSCHLSMDDPHFANGDQPLKTHPQPELFVFSGSPHPVETFGCTICHQGRGRGTSFITSAHTPDTRQAEEVWAEKYEWSSAVYPEERMLPLTFVQASCAKCHPEEKTLKDAPKLNKGRALLQEYGCYGCHKPVNGQETKKIGPDLRRIAQKTSKEWAFTWLMNHKKIKQKTRMPLFFNFPEDGIKKEREQVEASAIVFFLFSASEQIPYAQIKQGGNAGNGKLLFDFMGCTGCHSAEKEKVAPKQGDQISFAPSLFFSGSKLQKEWVYNWLKNPRAVAPDTVMPDFRLTDKEALDLTAYLMTFTESPILETTEQKPEGIDAIAAEFLARTLSPEETKKKLNTMDQNQTKIFLGKNLVLRYGCYGCHQIKGFETIPKNGSDFRGLGDKYLERFDFGGLRRTLEQSRHAWITEKMASPRIFDTNISKKPLEKLKMPHYNFSPDQTEAIVTALLSFTEEKLPVSMTKTLTEQEQLMAQGQDIVEKYNCIGCHILEGKGGDINTPLQNAYIAAGEKKEDAKSFIPPKLDGEGAKVKPEWLWRFLKAPYAIRPWLQTKMPTFSFSDQERTTLVKYFSLLAGKDYEFEKSLTSPPTQEQLAAGKKIFELLKCISCHPADKKSMEGIEAGDLAPDLSLAKGRLQSEWITEWLKSPQAIQKGTRMPTNWVQVKRRKKIRYVLPPSIKSILNGDVEKQIEAVKQYLLTLMKCPNRRKF